MAIEPPALLSLLHGIDKQRGGAEVLDRFYKVVFRAVDDNDGVIDHLAGNGVMALWTPRFGGRDHTTHPLTAGRQLVAQLIGDRVLRGRIPAGVGVHTGNAWVGVVGETGAHDFTVLGDAPNTVARLGSSSASGELLLSEAIAEKTSVDTSRMERRVLELKGKSEPFRAWVETEM